MLFPSVLSDGSEIVNVVDAMTVQFVARLLLLICNLWGWYRLARSVDEHVSVHDGTKNHQRRHQSKTQQQQTLPYSAIGSWLLIITACQFHMPFYSSRMLPNVFALVLVLQCYTYWLRGQTRTAAFILVVATTVFRCDLLLLLFCVGLSWLYTKQLSIVNAIKIGSMAGLVALLMTVPLDSMLWNQFVWPEGSVFWFNTILGKSSDWGVMVWHWYFTSAIPKLMLLTIMLVPLSSLRVVEILVSIEMNRKKRFWNPTAEPLSLGSVIDPTWLQYTLPIIGYVVLYSCLGHKEVRFIFPAVPILNLSAAVGITKLQYYAQYTMSSAADARTKKDDDYNILNDNRWPTSSLIGKIGFVCGILCLVMTLCGSMVFVGVSTQNYPGGVSLNALTEHIVYQIQHGKFQGDIMDVHVHIDNAAAMSGVSLFGQRAAQEATDSAAASTGNVPKVRWSFTKEGYEEEHSLKHLDDYHQFTHLLSEEPNVSLSFRVIQVIEGSPRISLGRMSIITQPRIYVLERDGLWQD